MSYPHAPHQGVSSPAAVNAALLIDFDNVTMGMKSDLGRDLKKLLKSDVIQGKITVQRAYADWRRFPQYIVPLSENSVDLIFAPAYGSSKKNATDIRMAIDAVELVFTRPEIGTFILLTGDSDFSSCVLKLKEYGKYVIGVGIQESSSDILVQNCDEYYSYNSLAGLQKTTDGDERSGDPWVLVDKAVRRMADRTDVMRSDRLKQVMIELDSSFSEGSFGFSKFSKFLAEAASRGLVKLTKMENGQFEVGPAKGGGRSRSRSSERDDEGRSRSRGRGRGRGRGRSSEDERKTEGSGESDTGSDTNAAEATVDSGEIVDDLRSGYTLLVRALEALRSDDRHPARDSDVKRKMLEFQRNFDETSLGFGKFSRFLMQAGADSVVSLEKQSGGNYEVSLGADTAAAIEKVEVGRMAPSDERVDGGRRRERSRDPEPEDTATQAESASSDESAAEPAAQPAAAEAPAPKQPVVMEIRPEDLVEEGVPGRLLGPRGGTTRRRSGEDAPPTLFEGQGRPSSSGSQSAAAPAVASAVASPVAPVVAERSVAAPVASDRSGEQAAHEAPATEASDSGADAREAALAAFEGKVDADALGLPTDAESQVRYLTNSYKGVGKKTAENLVEKFGAELFDAFQNSVDEVRGVLPAARADQVLTAWRDDLGRRLSGEKSSSGGGGRRRSRGRGRGRGRGGSSESQG